MTKNFGEVPGAIDYSPGKCKECGELLPAHKLDCSRVVNFGAGVGENKLPDNNMSKDRASDK